MFYEHRRRGGQAEDRHLQMKFTSTFQFDHTVHVNETPDLIQSINNILVFEKCSKLADTSTTPDVGHHDEEIKCYCRVQNEQYPDHLQHQMNWNGFQLVTPDPTENDHKMLQIIRRDRVAEIEVQNKALTSIFQIMTDESYAGILHVKEDLGITPRNRLHALKAHLYAQFEPVKRQLIQQLKQDFKDLPLAFDQAQAISTLSKMQMLNAKLLKTSGTKNSDLQIAEELHGKLNGSVFQRAFEYYEDASHARQLNTPDFTAAINKCFLFAQKASFKTPVINRRDDQDLRETHFAANNSTFQALLGSRHSTSLDRKYPTSSQLLKSGLSIMTDEALQREIDSLTGNGTRPFATLDDILAVQRERKNGDNFRRERSRSRERKIQYAKDEELRQNYEHNRNFRPRSPGSSSSPGRRDRSQSSERRQTQHTANSMPKATCYNWEKTGSCSFGNQCRFFHDPTKQKK